MKFSMLLIVVITVVLISNGCQTPKTLEPLNETQIRELAWNKLDETQQELVIGSDNDISYEDKYNSGVNLIVNNASEDVWKQSMIRYLSKDEIEEVIKKIKINTKHQKIIEVSFNTMYNELAGPFVIYVDPERQVVLGSKERTLNSNIILD